MVKLIGESFDMTGYEYRTNKQGYDLYCKKVDGKGKWIAVKDGQEPIEISYEQARGFEAIDPTDNKIQKKVANALKSEAVRGNTVTNHLPIKVDLFLETFVQSYGELTYTDILQLGDIWDMLERTTQIKIRHYVAELMGACNEMGMDIWEAADNDYEVEQMCKDLIGTIRSAIDAFID